MIKNRAKVTFRRRKVIGSCFYCQSQKTPWYSDSDLGKYVTDRARILARDRSGLCAKHQRKVALAIKRARHIGLLPFKVLTV